MTTYGNSGRKLTLDPTKKIKKINENHENFEQMMSNFNIIIKDAGYPVLKATARHTHGRLIARSPIVTGSYVLSHKVGLNGKDSSVTYGDPLPVDEHGERIAQPNRRSVVGYAIAKGQQVIAKAHRPKKFVLSNSIHYAPNVEFMGWANSPAYHVYALTLLEMREEMKPIVSEIHKKIFRLMTKVKNNAIKNKQMKDEYVREELMAMDADADTGMISGYGESKTGGAFDSDIVKKRQ
ncbi:MAG: hypothetical protein DRR04_13615 [Gammaproteobacteria bacterium]|nr:MAG: hypothetical protein DRR04_13615 [Gammaproteobacteria bacterium]RLA60105.1 MAG: hypothetical protein DRQ89_13265 [Campylobacterota bacterium]